jgi:hypothetical protein
MRMVRLWAAIACPVVALSSWFELDGIPALLTMLVAVGGGACTVILMREKQADKGIGGLTTLNLHR